MKKAVCLFSGGLDSATTLYTARAEEFETIALTLHYGQRHEEKETRAAARIAARLGLKHYVIPLPLPWRGSALLDDAVPIPTGRCENELGLGIPSTYVPARNSIFLALAASCAEAEGARAIFIGANALDYSGYPDCRPEYLNAFSEMIRKGTKIGSEGGRIEIRAPLLNLTKKEIILHGRRLGVPFEDTWSCYQGKTRPCGECDSCRLRAKGFREAGFEDPLIKNEPSAVR